MASDQIVNDTVKRMLDAGIDDATILSTLADVGLDGAKGKAIIAALRAPAPVQAAPVQSAPAQETSSDEAFLTDESPENLTSQSQVSDMDMMKTELETQGEVHQLHQATTQSTLDLHEDKLNEFDTKVEALKQSVAAASVQKETDPQIFYRLTELENKVSGMTSTVNATFDVMRKVLETNRSILTSLEAKK